MMNLGYQIIAAHSDVTVKEAVFSDIRNSLSMIFPLLCGFIFDKDEKKLMAYLRLCGFISGIVLFIGYWFNWELIMYCGYIFLSAIGVANYAMVIATINDNFTENKIAGICVF